MVLLRKAGKNLKVICISLRKRCFFDIASKVSSTNWPENMIPNTNDDDDRCLQVIKSKADFRKTMIFINFKFQFRLTLVWEGNGHHTIVHQHQDLFALMF